MDAYELLATIEQNVSDAGFTMADVCRKAGIQQSLVCRWRNQKYEPRLSSLQKLEDALRALKLGSLL